MATILDKAVGIFQRQVRFLEVNLNLGHVFFFFFRFVFF